MGEHGTYLSGTDDGKVVGRDLVKQAQKADGVRFIVAFHGVEGFNYSFCRASVGHLLEEINHGTLSSQPIEIEFSGVGNIAIEDSLAKLYEELDFLRPGAPPILC